MYPQVSTDVTQFEVSHFERTNIVVSMGLIHQYLPKLFLIFVLEVPKGRFILLHFYGDGHRERPLRRGTPSPTRNALSVPSPSPSESSTCTS